MSFTHLYPEKSQSRWSGHPVAVPDFKQECPLDKNRVSGESRVLA